MNKFLQDFDQELDDLKVQVELPTDELVEAFETRKTRFKAFVDEAKATVDEVEHNEFVEKLRGRLESLQVQLALGKAETRDAFEEQKEKLEEELHEAQQAYREWRDSATEHDGDMDAAFHRRAEHFRTQMDIFNVQFHLGVAEARDEWDELKEEVHEKVQDMKRFWEDRNKDGERRVEAFTDELSEAYDHLKGAVKRLFS